MKRCIFSILVLVMLFVYGQTYATDRYIATSGTDNGTCTAQASPCKTLRYAMGKMSGGDTLYIADGTYTGSSNFIDQNNLPPSGSPENYTTIRALNIPCQNGVACNQPLKVVFNSGAGINMNNWATSNYVKFQGIFFKASVGLFGTSHWYFKQCAVQGDGDGNNATVTNMSATYTIFEDMLAFGKGRYKFLFYDYNRAGTPQYAVCRRCIARNDWVSDSTNPMATFAVYFAHNVALINSIDIDSNSPSFWAANEIVGSMVQVVDTSSNVNFIINGSIVINSAMPAYYVRNQSGGHTFTDIVAVHTAGGIGAGGAISINRATIVDVNKANFSGYPVSVLDEQNNGIDYNGGTTVNNTVVSRTAGSAANANYSGDYFNYYSTSGNSFLPTHRYTTDPFLNGLLYPVRIENESTLKTVGSGGAQIGADITKILGVDGTEYGTADYNTPQGSLWPWPLESWVKAQMANMDTSIGGDTMPSPTRGFCGGTSKDGTAQTLTKYIWEYFGNLIPPEIYSVIAPSAPQNLRIVSN